MRSWNYYSFMIWISGYTWWNGKTNEKRKTSSNSLYQNTKTVVRRCSVKRFFLKISQSSQRNTCVGVSFNKVADIKTCNFIKKRHQHKSFPVKFAKFLRTLFFTKPPSDCFWMLTHAMDSYTTTQRKKLMNSYE